MKIFLFSIIIITVSNCFSQNNWDTFGTGVTSGGIYCFYEDTIDDVLIVGGAYKYIDGLHANGLAAYNGFNWQKCYNLNIPLYGGSVNSIIRYNGSLYVSGAIWFTWNNDTIPYIAKWDGTNWSRLPFMVNNTTSNVIKNMRIINNKLFFLMEADTIPGIKTNHILMYDGENYSAFDNLPPDYVQMLSDIAYYKGEYYISGTFFNSDDSIHGILKYDGTNWTNVGGGLKGNAGISKMLVYNNKLIVAGEFYKSNGNAGNNTMSWDGEEWSEFINLAGQNNYYDIFSVVHDMNVHNNKLYIGGIFDYANDVPCQKILVYDGNNVCSFGNEMNNNCISLGFYNDTLIVAGIDSIDHIDVNRIAKWIGGNNFDTCSVLESVPQINNELNNLIIYPNPANGEFNIKLNTKTPSEVEITIFNINGSKTFEKQFHQTNEIKIDNLHPEKGVYFVKIKTDKFIEVEKLIIN